MAGLKAVSDLVLRKEVIMRLANVSTYQNDFSGFRGRLEGHNLPPDLTFVLLGPILSQEMAGVGAAPS